MILPTLIYMLLDLECHYAILSLRKLQLSERFQVNIEKYIYVCKDENYGDILYCQVSESRIFVRGSGKTYKNGVKKLHLPEGTSIGPSRGMFVNFIRRSQLNQFLIAL